MGIIGFFLLRKCQKEEVIHRLFIKIVNRLKPLILKDLLVVYTQVIPNI